MKKITILGILCILAVACSRKRAFFHRGVCLDFRSPAKFAEANVGDVAGIEKCPEADLISKCEGVDITSYHYPSSDPEIVGDARRRRSPMP
jgi:hypothetical protein